jgi:hypothetical protein
MKKLVFAVFTVLISVSATYSQSARQTVERFFDAFNQKDTAALHNLCLMPFALQTVYIHKADTLTETATLAQLLGYVASEKALFEERILDVQIKDDGLVAQAFVPYTFLLNHEPLHCGTNALVLVKSEGKWKISSITDSRRKCPEAPTEESVEQGIHQIMDAWHKAAAEAKFDTYFGMTHSSFVFLGTDSSERWTRQEFMEYCRPHFNKGKAWSFTAENRFIHFNEARNTVWIDEKLSTQMGPCRGTGVLVKQNEKWLLTHYSLTVLVPNEKMKTYLKNVWGRK